jgi:hypothetical protein
MLAGGMVIAAPSMVPEAAAAGQLFVSAENANFDNYFAGIQVVEVIVKDPNRIDTDENESEPTVKVDEHLLRMVQGADGYWYAYIADTTDVAAAVTASNVNIDFGDLAADSAAIAGNFDSAATVYLNTETILGGTPTVTTAIGTTVTAGQNSVTADWPFIQTFDFTIETFEVKLEQAGADEIVVLTHDNDDIDNFAGVELDRNAATNGAEVHLTITDQALNIDPTTEDVIVFNVDSGNEGVSFKMTSDYHQVATVAINAAGSGYAVTNVVTITAADGTPATATVTEVDTAGAVTELDLTTPGSGVLAAVTGGAVTSVTGTGLTVDTTLTSDYNAFSNGFDENGILLVNYDANSSGTPVLTNSITADDKTADDYLVFWESAENSGIFLNTDDDDNSNLNVSTDALRGTTATIDYNDSAQSFVVAHSFATIDMDAASVGDELNSGDEMTIVLYDQDLNLNTFKDEDLTVAGNTRSINTNWFSFVFG